MAFLVDNLISCYRSYFYPEMKTSPFAQKTAIELFKDNLSAVEMGTMSANECVENCRENLQALVANMDCTLTENSQRQIIAMHETFAKEVHLSNGLRKVQAEIVLNSFKCLFAGLVEEKWAEGLAVSFHGIPGISQEQEKVEAVMRWSEQFFCGECFFRSWQEGCREQSSIHLRLGKVKSSFLDYDKKVLEMKLKTALKRLEKNGTPDLICYHPYARRGENWIDKIVWQEHSNRGRSVQDIESRRSFLSRVFTYS